MRKALYYLGILNDVDIDWLVAAAVRRQINAGVNLIDEGVPIDDVFLVLEGAFTVRTASFGGREVARLLTGEVLGEMSFIDSAVPCATVQASERSLVLAIPRHRLKAKLVEDDGFAARFYRAVSMFLAERLRNTLAGLSDPVAAGGHTGTAVEINLEALDNIALSGARFDWIQRRLKSC